MLMEKVQKIAFGHLPKVIITKLRVIMNFKSIFFRKFEVYTFVIILKHCLNYLVYFLMTVHLSKHLETIFFIITLCITDFESSGLFLCT